MIKSIILAATLGAIAAEIQSYRPRGWRPDGPSFEPTQLDRLQTYGSPPQSYEHPIKRPTYPQRPAATTVKPINIEPSATPRTREPTTPSPDITDENVESNPAFAIANSFAFNRPVYVYNTYPFHPGLTFAQ